MIMILGESDLSKSIKNDIFQEDCIIIGKSSGYDFTKKEDCDKLISLYGEKTTLLINTIGMIPNKKEEHWDSFLVNYVAPCYLTTNFFTKMLNNSQIINISSASAWWISYPDMNLNRFVYNTSKSALSEFNKNFNRVIVDSEKNITITTIEPGAFKSKMSGNKGMTIDKIVNLVRYAIDGKLQHISLVRDPLPADTFS
jgi:short-subunit dehydrogenase